MTEILQNVQVFAPRRRRCKSYDNTSSFSSKTAELKFNSKIDIAFNLIWDEKKKKTTVCTHQIVHLLIFLRRFFGGVFMTVSCWIFDNSLTLILKINEPLHVPSDVRPTNRGLSARLA